MVDQSSDVSHQAMGYDRTSIMFSPDGRLLQVEYAKKTVKQGTTAVGIVCKDGVLLVADKRVVDKLIVSKSIEKVFQVDEHIGATASGILSDGRVLIEKAQVIAQQHRVTYDEPIEPETLVKEISNLKQQFTQYGGARPFGVSLLFIGVDDKPSLFVTDPTGIFFEYKATAIGEFDTEVKDLLDKQYRDGINVQDGLKLGVGALKKVLGKDFSVDRLDGAVIYTDEKQFKRLKKEDFLKIKW
ncbi:MAG: archaeal proteasome endopeptidase complex subunit alpha [Candidatus Woesearchaeota archaeon]|jgi:proteasome alpha subunit|nr:archaeal proteasome endopeptidase complex subunit alpha [Candidatus Woesearchaeota archaeon]